MIEKNFWIIQLIVYSLHFTIAYLNGRLVRDFGVKVNYTRKVNHFLMFFLPVFLNHIFAYEHTLVSIIIGMSMMVCSLVIFIEPVRSRIRIVRTAFLSFDRPEDRPYTLLWLSTQITATALVMIATLIYLESINMITLIYIPIIINGIGDGLAEPVGIRFGRHPYKTKALFTKTRFVRTLEGSACVFAASVLSILLFKDMFSPVQFMAALVCIPIIMTLAEAVSPHTWDSPVLYSAAGISLFGILLL